MANRKFSNVGNLAKSSPAKHPQSSPQPSPQQPPRPIPAESKAGRRFLSRPMPSQGVRVREVAERFFESLRLDTGPMAEKRTRHSAKAFLEAFGELPIDALTLDDLQRFKAHLIDCGLSPVTINHYVQTGKRIAGYASDYGFSQPLPLKRVKMVRLPVPVNQGKSPEQVAAMIGGAYLSVKDCQRAESLKAHLELIFLAALRVSEVLRLVNGIGIFEKPNVFIPSIDGEALDKCSKKTGHARRIYLTDAALDALKRATPYWNAEPEGLSAFSTFAHHYCKAHFPPRLLRHSSAQGMLDAGADIQAVKLALGHSVAVVGRITSIYCTPPNSPAFAALKLLPPLLAKAYKKLDIQQRPRLKRIEDLSEFVRPTRGRKLRRTAFVA
jgi:site-specific recombinase XerD